MNKSRFISASLLLASAPGLLAISGALQPILAISLMGIVMASAFYFYYVNREITPTKLSPIRISTKVRHRTGK